MPCHPAGKLQSQDEPLTVWYQSLWHFLHFAQKWKRGLLIGYTLTLKVLHSLYILYVEQFLLYIFSKVTIGYNKATSQSVDLHEFWWHFYIFYTLLCYLDIHICIMANFTHYLIFTFKTFNIHCFKFSAQFCKARSSDSLSNLLRST